MKVYGGVYIGALTSVTILVVLGFLVSNNFLLKKDGCPAFTRGASPVAGSDGALPPGWREVYLDLVRDSLTGALLRTPALSAQFHEAASELQPEPFDSQKRVVGSDWPQYGFTMVGSLRLRNIQQALEAVLEEGIPGSFVECGVWRGGASIFAAAVLAAHGATGREVHLVDSFDGLPPNTTVRDNLMWSRMEFLEVSLEEVRDNFRRYNLLTPDVHFHRGYFRYALPAWRASDTGAVAVLRMDGDMWESTVDTLYNLWDSVAVGGFVIVDDYPSVPEAKAAVDEFLARNAIRVELQDIDGRSVFFRKPSAAAIDNAWYAAWNASRNLDDRAR